MLSHQSARVHRDACDRCLIATSSTRQSQLIICGVCGIYINLHWFQFSILFCVYVNGYLQKELPCCWECKTCRDNEIIVDGTRCQQCNLTTWPDDVTATECLPIAATYLRWTDTLSVALLFLTLIGKIDLYCFKRVYLV